MRRRRRFSRTFAGKRGGRSYYWIRFTPFNVPLVAASTATHSDILLTESDWANPSSDLNQTRRGGPRLERLITEFGLSVQGSNLFWNSNNLANLALIPEFMLWKQSDQFVSTVQSSASFSQTRDNQRVIMDEVPGERTWQMVASDGTSSVRTVYGKFETKSKVRLSEGAIGIAWRGFFDTGETAMEGYTDWVRPTILMSTP